MWSVQYELQNAYIGEIPRREPNDNTILYLSFWTWNWDLIDRSWKWNTVTQSVSGYNCLNSQGKSWCCAYFQNNANYRIQVANTSALQWWDNAYFGMFWKLDSISFQDTSCMLFAKWYDSMTNWFFLWFTPYNNNTQLQISNNRRTWMSWESHSNTNTRSATDQSVAPVINYDTNWHHFWFSRINKYNRLYLDWELIGYRDCSWYSFNYSNNALLYIWAQIYWSYTQWDYPFNGRIDEFIYENRWWTQDEIQLYLSQFN